MHNKQLVLGNYTFYLEFYFNRNKICHSNRSKWWSGCVLAWKNKNRKVLIKISHRKYLIHQLRPERKTNCTWSLKWSSKGKKDILFWLNIYWRKSTVWNIRKNREKVGPRCSSGISWYYFRVWPNWFRKDIHYDGRNKKWAIKGYNS